MRAPETPRAAEPRVTATLRGVAPAPVRRAPPEEEPGWEGLAQLLREPTPREEMYELLAEIGVIERPGRP